MSTPDALEVIVLSATTSETKASGKVRKVSFLLPNDEGEHPFSGMIGERLHIVCLKINDDETTVPVVTRHGPRAGVTGDACASDEAEEVVESARVGGPVKKTAADFKDRKRWDELPPSQQAAIRCGEPEFQRFCDENSVFAITNEAGAARHVRNYCRVDSRSSLNDNPEAAARWRALDNEFWAWQRGYDTAGRSA